MGDAEELRARASRLFAFALNARELGIEGYAMALTKLANDALAEAEEIARIALFLLSDESIPMTGEVIRGDAGWAVTG